MNLFYTFLSISKDLPTIHSKHIPLSQLLSSLNTSVVHGVLTTLYVSVLKGFHQNWTEQTTSHNEWSFVKCVDKKRFIYRIKDRVILGMQSHLAIFLWPTRIKECPEGGGNLRILSLAFMSVPAILKVVLLSTYHYQIPARMSGNSTPRTNCLKQHVNPYSLPRQTPSGYYYLFISRTYITSFP